MTTHAVPHIPAPTTRRLASMLWSGLISRAVLTGLVAGAVTGTLVFPVAGTVIGGLVGLIIGLLAGLAILPVLAAVGHSSSDPVRFRDAAASTGAGVGILFIAIAAFGFATVEQETGKVLLMGLAFTPLGGLAGAYVAETTVSALPILRHAPRPPVVRWWMPLLAAAAIVPCGYLVLG